MDLLDTELYGGDDPLFHAGVAALGHLAGRWRATQRTGESLQAKRLEIAYLNLCQYLWNCGWRGEDLSLEDELPDSLMPPYLIDYWRDRKHKS